jgi:hypothetical protein
MEKLMLTGSAKYVITTLGEDGALLMEKSCDIFELKVTEFEELKTVMKKCSSHSVTPLNYGNYVLYYCSAYPPERVEDTTGIKYLLS